jgi:Zinc knuckle
VWLLKQIKAISHQFDTKQYMYLSLLDARAAYINCRQGLNQTDAEYFELFTANVQVLEYFKANVGEVYTLADDPTGRLTEAARKKLVRDRSIAAAFLRGADPRRYSALLADLANQYTRGNCQYPADLTSAYSLIINFHGPVTHQPQSNPPTTNNTNQAVNQPPVEAVTTHPDVGPHTFAQAARGSSSASTTSTNANATPGSDGIVLSGVTCFTCNKPGHLATKCPSAISLLQHAYVLTQTSNGTEHKYASIPNSWILLDSQSTPVSRFLITPIW